MSADDNKAIYNRYIDEGFNKGCFGVLDELLSSDYVYHEAPPGTPLGAEGIRQVITAFRTAFPDLEITIDDQVAEGNKVASRSTMRGTHQGPLFGIPPTGRKVAMTGMTMVEVVDGKITGSWVKNDVLGLFQQLGVKPPGGPA